ncbi:hypothetical protein BC826DRAFT_1109559 [Russula brevipes]|nr:hypothetical protein BC826DRAFT_1109559 [Russula brevipes]
MQHSVLTASSHNHTQEAVPTDRSSEAFKLAMEERLTHRQKVFYGPRGSCQTTIDDLPDDALLGIFDFYLDDKNPSHIHSADKWHTLVHVCRWWRSVVFASPRRLDLRLFCTRDRSVRTMLDIWPALPILLEYQYPTRKEQEEWPNNIIAALEHPDRVRHISIKRFPRAWETLAGAMQVPFSELTYLQLWLHDIPPLTVLPGGSAPRLRTLDLSGIPFPAVRDLILSASYLVRLSLSRSGYVPPESMVACLSSLKRLESLELDTEWFEIRPDQPGPPPQARAVLPALAKFSFDGPSQYLGDFVACIDTPVLSRLDVTLEDDGDFVFDKFDIPHLSQFIDRATALKPSNAARVSFYSYSIILECPPRGSELGIVWPSMDFEISSMTLVCNQLSPFFSLVERLVLIAEYDPHMRDGIESTLFLELFRPFTATQDLYVSESLVPFIAPALQEPVGEMATEVLPNLRNLFLGGSVQEAIQPFLDARRLSGRPIAIHRWEEEEAYQ